ncbi:CARDB domain-containing protein [Myxococcus sp. MxC21-1]|uniref:CARDB domain-containing protein n=1 Tax=Myxococcus sp. MxC21-1 TaxID=3041439 RepID=UPI002930A0C1|nr:CARDB domain-containing protein [Myxococcus sp. MxC21-1]WNZ63995.1 CARDB domain-containing protein [Myxococcus sp. MxC21-1]
MRTYGSEHVSAYQHDGTSYGIEAGIAPRVRVAQAFFLTHDDAYDFLVVLPTFDVDLGPDVAGLHTSVRNDVHGIGRAQFNRAGEFGSAGRLKAYIDLRALSPNVQGTTVDTATALLAHEVSHQWTGRVRYRREGTAHLSDDLLGQNGAHWSFFFDSDASVLYGSDWEQESPGVFAATASQKRYSNLDLYLMGFLSPLEVGPLTLLQPETSSPYQATDLPPPLGTRISATAQTLSVADIIRAEGERQPAMSRAQKSFRAAFIILTPPGGLATAAQVQFVDALRKRFEQQFFFLTQGRGVFETDLVESPPGQVAESPGVQLGLDYLFAQQLPSGAWGQGASAVRETHHVLDALRLFYSDPRAPEAVTQGGAYLAGLSLLDADSLARRALALRDASAQTAERLASLRGLHGGAGLVHGYAPSTLDSILVGRAVRLAGEVPTGLDPLTPYLLGQQNEDGGWPLMEGGPSRFELTSLVMEHLASVQRTPEVTSAAGKALAYLRAQRRPGGLYAEERESARATAWALLALSAWRQLGVEEAQQAATALLARQRTDGSWDGSPLDTALALRALRIALAPNLSLADSDLQLSTSTAVEGETVLATVRFFNTGYATASNVLVRAFDSTGTPLGEGQRVASIAAGERAQVTLRLDTSASRGSSRVFVRVDANNEVDESSEADNGASQPLFVSEPSEGVDLVVHAGSVTVTPSKLTRLPSVVNVTAVVGNLGQTASSEVEVQVRLGTQVLAQARRALAPRTRAALSWDVTVSSLAQNSAISVVVDALEEQVESREDNNIQSAPLERVQGVDLSVASVTVDASVEQGRDAVIHYQVANSGTVPASVTPVIEIQDGSGATRANLAGATLQVPAGGQVSAQVVWRAGVSGAMRAVVRVTHADDLDPSNDTKSADFNVTASGLANLQVVGNAITLTPSRPLETKSATARATLRNSGLGETPGFSVDWYLGNPAEGGTRVFHGAQAPLAAGAMREVSATFTVPIDSPRALFLVLDAEGAVSEFDEDDNQVLLALQPIPIADLVLAAADILPQPAFPQEGSTVAVSVSVLNAGGQDAEAVSVQLLLAVPGLEEVLLGEHVLDGIPAGARREAAFAWDTVGVKGSVRLVAHVNRAGTTLEGRSDNNRAEKAVVVQDATLALSELYISPNGDGVKDSSEVVYRLNDAAPVSVRVLDEDGQEVRALNAASAQAGTLVWDGRSERGRVVPDGTYRLMVSAAAAGGQVLMGTLSVVVDTNRFPLEKSAASSRELENLDSFVNLDRYDGPFVSMPDESGVVFNGWSLSTAQRGIYLQPLGGAEPRRLTRDDWDGSFDGQLALSRDGRLAVFAGAMRTPSGSWAHTLTRLDFSDGQLTRLVTDTLGQGASTYLNRRVQPVLDADGAVLFFASRQSGAEAGDISQLEAIRTDGTGRRVLAKQDVDVVEMSLSPDGRAIAFVTGRGALYRVNVDGTGLERLLPDFTISDGRYPDGRDTRIYSSDNLRHSWLPDGEAIAYVEAGPLRYVRTDCYEGCQDIYEAASPALNAVDVHSKATRPLYRGRAGSIDFLASFAALHVNPLSGGILFRSYLADDETAWTWGVTGLNQARLFVEDGLDGGRFSPGGTFIHGFMSFGADVPEAYRALSTRDNLTAKLAATRKPGASAISFTGTAADANFESLEIGVRPYRATSPFVAIFRGASPVVRGSLGSWTPPGPGLYEVQLLVRDKAGNVRTRRTTVGYSDRPVVANLTREPEYFSPNGDNVLDEVSVHYTMTAPASIELRVLNEAGRVVRHLSRTHTAAGDYGLVWDGRDDNGVVAADGRYILLVEGNELGVTLDTTAPRLTLSLSDIAASTAYVVTVPGPSGRELVQVMQGGISLKAEDEALVGWTLETGRLDAPSIFDAWVSGTERAASREASLSELGGRLVRLHARDLAGNEAVTDPQGFEEQLFVTEVARSFDTGQYWLLPGRALPRMPGHVPVENATSVGRVPYSGPGEYVFLLEDSVARPFTSFSIAYRVPGEQEWRVDHSNVSNMGDALVVWDTQLIGAISEFEVRALDADGRTFTRRVYFGVEEGRSKLLACAQSRGAEKALLVAEFEGAAGDVRLLPGALWTLERLDGAGEQLRIPVKANVVSNALGWSFREAISTASLRGCVYRTGFSAIRANGEPLMASGELDLCVVQLTSQGGGVLATESFREGGLRSLEVFARAKLPEAPMLANPEVLPVARLGAFSGQSPTVPLDLTRLPNGGEYVLYAQGFLANGSPVATRGTLELGALKDVQSCWDEARLHVPPPAFSLANPMRNGEAPLCSVHQPSFTASISGSITTGQAFSSLSVALNSAEGASLFNPAISGFTPGSSSFNARYTLDPATLPEGVYWPLATATWSDGKVATAKSAPLFVDRTPAVAVITSPSSGGRVCRRPRREPNGTLRYYIEVEGQVADAHLESIDLLARAGGSNWVPQERRDFSPLTATSVQGLLGRVDVTQMGADVEVLVSARDASGSSWCAVPVPVELAGTVAVASLAIQPAIFSPTAAQTIALSFSVTEGAQVLVSAWKGTVRQGTVAEASFGEGAASLTWDGQLLEGGQLDDGDYRLVLQAVDACGGEAERAVMARVDTTPPVARLDTPEQDAVAGAALVVTGEASDVSFVRYELAVGEGVEPAEFTPVLIRTAPPASGVLGTVPTGTLPVGEYVLRLTVEDAVGHTSQDFRRFVRQPTSMLLAASVTPALISPNAPSGDGVLDEAAVVVELAAPASVGLALVDAQGAVVAPLQSPTLTSQGVTTVVLGPEALAGVADGTYFVRVDVVDSGETLRLPLMLDTTRPTLSLTQPVSGSARRASVAVEGAITDLHLEDWKLEHVAPGGGTTLVAAGTTSPDGVLAQLDGLQEGDHLVRVTAVDGAGNVRTLDVPFVVDVTPPVVAFKAPLNDAFLSGVSGPVGVAGSAEDEGLANVQLSVVRGAQEKVLFTGASLPAQGDFYAWAVAQEADGPVELVLSAEDAAGNRSESRISVTLDSTPPTALVASPRSAALGVDRAVRGTASDGHLTEWRLSLSPAASPLAWREVASSTQPVTEGLLATLASPPVDGAYRARLAVKDRAGNESTDEVDFFVDTQPPEAPLTLVATVQRPNDVSLTWTASLAVDAVAHEVWRAPLGADLVRIATVAAPATAYLDAALADGTWQYVVRAVDGAGNLSDDSPAASVEVDSTPPLVVLRTPAPNALVRGLVEVVGTAFSAVDFKEYRLSIGEGASPSAWVVLVRSPLPVPGGTLFELDAGTLRQGALYTLLLEAEDSASNVAETRVGIRVDNQPPAAPVLLSATAQGDSVAVQWQAVSDEDLLGYVLFRDGALANAPEGVALEDLRPYALMNTQYTNAQVPDGVHAYHLVAIDQAGNISPPSNTLSVTVETRAPSARLTEPASLARLRGATRLLAHSEDGDIASVRMEGRGTPNGDFVALGAPVTRFPYEGTLTSDMPAGRVVELRAIATDTQGNVDASPRSLHVLREAIPARPALTARVDEEQVHLSWDTDAAQAGVSGFEVLVNGESRLPYPGRPAGTASASSGTASEAARGYDGSSGTFWRSGTESLKQWQVLFTEPFLLDAVSLSMQGLITARVEGQVDGFWVELAPAVTSRDQWLPEKVTLESPLEVAGLRLTFTQTPFGTATLYEVSAFQRAMTRDNSWTDIASPGDYSYELKALGFGGTASEPGTVKVRVYRPALDAPVSPTADTTVVLRGHEAAANAAVELLSGDTVVAATTSDAAGDFTFTGVVVHEGSNMFEAQATDATGNRSMRSESVEVVHAPRPQASVALTLDGVEQSTVSLSFVVSGDTAGLAGFALLRGSGDGAVEVATAGPEARAFVDAHVRNGTYTYQVVSLNAEHLRGAPSNEVQAIVAVANPPAPMAVIVESLPEGGALRVQWQTGGSAAAFRVERALGATGAFEAVPGHAATRATSLIDLGLVNGALYRYQVMALDAQGNVSAPAEASGMPLDTTAPDAPRFTFPTVAGSPVTFSESSTRVAGVAEVGAVVTLYRNGVPYADAPTGEQVLETSIGSFAHPPLGDVTLSSNGRYLAYLRADVALPTVVVEEVGGGVVGTVESAFSTPDAMVPSPDGAFVAVEGYSDESGRMEVHVARLATGAAWQVGASQQMDVGNPIWSPDSRQLVVLMHDGDTRLKRVEVDSQTEADLELPGHTSIRRPVFTPHGTLLFVGSSTSEGAELVEVDWDSRLVRSLFRADEFSLPLVVAPDFSRMAVWARLGTSIGLHGINLSTAQTTLLTDQYVNDDAVSFSPDGKQLAVVTQDGDVLVGADGPLAVVGHVDEGWGRLGWSRQWDLVWAGYERVTHLELLGRFEFEDVALSPGSTLFGATASDASLNMSGPAEPIDVRVDGQGLPDLLAEVSLVPEVVSVGGPATAVITVRNVGGAAAPAHDVSVGVRSPDGALRVVPLLAMGPLAAGTSITAEVPLPVEGLTGAQVLEVGVDARAVVADANRDNNQVHHPFTIAVSSLPGVAVSLDVSTVPVEGQRLVTVTVTNPGPPLTGQVELDLVGADGGVARLVEPTEVLTSLPTGQSHTFTRTVVVGTLLAGVYEVRATLWKDGAAWVAGGAALSVLPEETAVLSVATSRTRYLSGEEAEVLTEVTSTSRNSFLEGAMLWLTLRTSGGTLVEQRQVPLPRLLPGRVENQSTSFSTAALSPGNYQVTSMVMMGAQVLAQAQTSFGVEGRPRISGLVSIAGQTGTQPYIRTGQVATVDVLLENRGTAPEDEAVVSLVVTRPDGSLFTAASWPLAALAPGAQWTQQQVLSTVGWALGNHGLTLVMEHPSGASEVLSRLSLLVMDGRAPRLTLVNLSEGMFVRDAVSAHVRALDDASGVAALRVAVNGTEEVAAAPVSGNALDGVWRASLSLATEGPHLLVFSAADAAGNDGRVLASLDNPVSVTVIRDTLPPELTVTGVPGEVPVHGPVVPVFSAQDAHLSTVSATLDGAPFASGTAISTDGVYELHVVATDRAGNISQVQRRFTVDTLPPRIVLGGVEDGAIVNHDVTPTVAVTDLHLEAASPTVTLNGQPFTTGSVVSGEADYVLRTLARDVAGHVTEAELAFTIDKTLPDIQVTGVSNGAVANAFTIHFTATDAHLDVDTLQATVDDMPFNSGGTVNAEGPHVLRVSVSDKAGNARVVTVSFSVVTADPLMPPIRYAVCGVQDALVYGEAEVVGPTVNDKASVAANSLAYVGQWSFVSGDLVGGYSAVVEQATLVGSLYYGEGYAIGADATVQGGVHLVASMPTPCTCSYDVAANLAQASMENDNARLSSLPGSSTWWVDGAFELNGVHVVLPAGRYYAEHLHLTGGATLSVEPGARVLLFIGTNVVVEGGSTLGASPAASHPMTVVSGAKRLEGQHVQVSNAADASLTVYAPEADLNLSGNSTLYGALMGKTVELWGAQRLVLKPGPQASPPSLFCE